MGKALYRKYRSRKLSEIVGQEHVTTLLGNALKQGRIAHAYLFTGPRGVGKTSIARILAHEINQIPYDDDSTHLDIIEIDAASNNGVDDIRDLREKVNLAPSSASKKIYIIDEVHMLSKPAFNALLKTLEEPPEHVVFILATTDVDKLPETIISRTQRYTFRRASVENLIKNLKQIAKGEGITITDEALTLIAEHADGGYRDSVSLLDQMVAITPNGETITADLIESSLGLASKTSIDTFVAALIKRDFENSLKILKTLEANGVQAAIIAEQLIRTIESRVSESPELLSLIDELLKVSTSPMPYAKLLAIIGLHTKPEQVPKPVIHPKSVATAVTAPIPELAVRAKEEHPKELVLPKKETIKPSKKMPSSKSAELNWNTFEAFVKSQSIALASILTKCGHELNSNTLTLYARNEFYKKKLENPKYRQILQIALEEQADVEWDVVIIPGVKPSANSQVAAVAAMMGGGEEVSLEE